MKLQYAWWKPYLCILPFFLGFAVFSLVPIVYSFIISLTEWNGFVEPVFIGLDNYRNLLYDELFYTALRNTAKIVVIFVVLLLGISLVASFLLHMKYVRGQSLFQTLFFLPYITTPVAVGFLFKSLFDWQFGAVNKLLLELGIIREPIHWLAGPQYTGYLIAMMVVWQSFGYCIVMLTAGLKGVSQEIYEAASIDGCRGDQLFMKITVPLLRPVITFLVITLMIWGLQIFDETFLFYGPTGGPDYSALTMVSYLYTTAFTDQHFGYGAAIGYALSVIIIILTLLMLKLLQGRRDVA
jgi:cellobiose transport system permease protein